MGHCGQGRVNCCPWPGRAAHATRQHDQFDQAMAPPCGPARSTSPKQTLPCAIGRSPCRSRLQLRLGSDCGASWAVSPRRVPDARLSDEALRTYGHSRSQTGHGASRSRRHGGPNDLSGGTRTANRPWSVPGTLGPKERAHHCGCAVGFAMSALTQPQGQSLKPTPSGCPDRLRTDSTARAHLRVCELRQPRRLRGRSRPARAVAARPCWIPLLLARTGTLVPKWGKQQTTLRTSQYNHRSGILRQGAICD